MPISEKGFSGVMNLDDNNDVLPQSHHKEARNVVFRGNGTNQIAQNVYGNTKITNASLPATGTNICIGSYYDQLKQRLFYFNYNSLGYDGIYVIDTIAKTISPLLISLTNSTEALFSFNANNPIASVNILYRTDEDGDILHWTDGLNRPKKLNINEAISIPKLYGNLWKAEYLTVARKMPLISPVCKYSNDTGTNINNLKNRVFQFSYRWVYKDGTKSTFSPISRLFAPANVDTLTTEIDPTKNNVINVTYNSGGADVVSIEMAARQSLVDTFSDYFLVTTLNKPTLGIGDNTNYVYDFYNSQSYPFIDINETTLLYSLVPTKANAQELLNGNQLIYGGITEGKSPTAITATSSVSLVSNTNAVKLTMAPYDRYTLGYVPPNYTYVSGSYYVVLDGTPVAGDVYSFTLIIRKLVSGTFSTANVTVSVTVTTATQAAVETQIYNALVANSDMSSYGLASTVQKLNNNPSEPNFPNKYGVKIGGYAPNNAWVLNSYNYIYTYAGGGLPPDPTGVNTACYKHNSRYGFGIAYFDEYGVTNGVNTSVSMNILTPEMSVTLLSTDQPTIPAISFSVSNPPPSWAKSFSFVRTSNLSISTFKTITTDRTFKDANYGYLDITTYNTNTSGYTPYEYVKGDRMRLCGIVGAASAVNDYPILDLLDNPTISGTPYTGTFIKVQYDSGTMSTFGTANNWYIEPYTPALNTSQSNTQVYYEFGETYYTTIDVNSNLVHTGQIQNQIIGAGAQPATFTFYRGDIYERQRQTKWILSQSMSDLFTSEIDGNGRPLIQDPSAKESYYPTLVRYSQNYQQGTQNNKTNIFYTANFDEYDRQRGDIRRLKVRGSQMRVFQSRGCGVVGVFENMIFNADGSDNLIQTDKIINTIHYYSGNYGMGWMNTSLASSANADYFVDPVRGYQVRLSQDGMTPISELYKAQYYITTLAGKYVNSKAGTLGGYAKVLGVYDFYEEEYVSVFQAYSGQANTTLAFNEARNCYTTFYDYAPEWIHSVESSIISFKSGEAYIHNNTSTYNTFYGTSYPASITLVYNPNPSIKKDFNSITQDATPVWLSSTMGDVTTSLGQSSNLVASDYDINEGFNHAAFMRDTNSIGGVVNGDYLKGNWLQTKLSSSSTNFVYLSGVYVNFTISQRNG
jgi:hypothetical protein